MRKFKATKAGVLSNPYQRVREGEVISLPADTKAKWLVPVEDFVPEPEKPTVPHMVKAPVDTGRAPGVAPAPQSEQYQKGMETIVAKEAVEDGKAADLEAAKAAQSNVTEVEPNKFVGDAVPTEAPAAPVETAPAPAAPAEQTEGTGNADVIG